MGHAFDEDRTFFQALIGDGRPLLMALALGLLTSGGVALFLAATGHFLPHDEQFLGMSSVDLCARHGCRVVHFMIHDRAAFGGVLVAVGLIYLWLIEFPMRLRADWAWWTLFFSGTVGFASFLAYLGYGYLDTWHAAASLVMLPCFLLGLYRTRRPLTPTDEGLDLPRAWPPWWSTAGIGRGLLLGSSLGITLGGLVILGVGMTAVFVPQDLAYLGVSAADLNALNPRLVPLIAHDRAGFGGALVSVGLALSATLGFGRPSRSLWQVLALVGIAGYGPALAVHFAIHYTDAVHLAPAFFGAILHASGLVLLRGLIFRESAASNPRKIPVPA